MNGVIQCPPGTFGYMGVEKMYFQQPSLFPSIYMNTTLKVTESPFLENVLDTGTSFLTYNQTSALTASSFQSNFVFNGIIYPVALADIGYDGSGGYILASYLDCPLNAMQSTRSPCFLICIPILFSLRDTGFQVLSVHQLERTQYCDLDNWNALSTVTLTTSASSKVDMTTA